MFGILDINAIVEEALKEFPAVGIDVIIRGTTKTGTLSVCTRLSPLHFSDNPDKHAAEPAKPSAFLKPIIGPIKAVDLQGEIECIPMNAYKLQYQTGLPTLVLLAGIVITILLMGLLFLLTGRTTRVRRLAAQRTQDLRASEQRFRRLVENAGDAFFLHEVDGRILDVNKAACDSLGYSRDELLHMNVSDLDVNFISDKLVDYHTLPEAEYPVTISSVHRRKDGSTFPVEVRLAPINVGNKRLILGLARDITERKLAEKKLHTEQRLLREMLDLMEQDRKLVSYEIHDGLAQQLTGAQMQFQSVEHLLDKNPPAARKVLDKALQLLQEAMAETRRLIGGLRPPVLDQSGIAAAVEDLISGRRTHDGPEIEFVNHLEPQRFASPLESAVFRIVQESLTNACRHSQSKKVRVELGLAGDRLRIDVQDWGIGFDPDQVNGGHFGLRGIRERARLLGGSAEIKSSPEHGTHVRVELPLLTPAENGNGAGSGH